ncbi:biotin synthase auxiliary protein BsaP [Micromonospora sp. WMMC241]|uniref:biotin synthase auxiliary protein BsaP n=1 Tax=Micromonospora sp. WMMC241 TaxID=3015159 RepID=UPI003FA56C6E
MVTELTRPAAPAGGASPTGRVVAADGATAEARWCDRCGESVADGAHAACAAARALEPPRWCAACRRRMKVQVVPAGWSAVCVEHGERRG